MVNLQLDATVSSVRWCYLPKNSHIAAPPSIKRNTWVKLLEPLTSYSHDEALLLCQQSENEWIGWIPNYGETLLNIEQFCLDPSEIDNFK